VGCIGAGRVGSVLTARLRAAGYPIAGVSGSSDASRMRVDTMLPGVERLAPEDVAEAADVVILAVPDDALEDVARKLAPHVRPGQFVLHTSGRHGLEALAPMAANGARPIALHPAMTFTGTHVDLVRACVFGGTAAEPDRAFADELVAELGGSIEWIGEENRVAYHAALAHGANHLNTLVSQAMDILRATGVSDPAALLRPLLEASLDNTLAYGDAALTGPVARGDVETVRAHLMALGEPERPTYIELARATAERAAATGRITAETAAAIEAALDDILVKDAR
jgi:predicted short-subunit dehydrogenase-like oxidoreductase (DUF2520 family)